MQSSESRIADKSAGAWMWTPVTCYKAGSNMYCLDVNPNPNSHRFLAASCLGTFNLSLIPQKKKKQNKRKKTIK